MSEYKDQSVWYELWGYDGVRWEFIADGETSLQMQILAGAEGVTDSYDQTRIKRVSGLSE